MLQIPVQDRDELETKPIQSGMCAMSAIQLYKVFNPATVLQGSAVSECRRGELAIQPLCL